MRSLRAGGAVLALLQLALATAVDAQICELPCVGPPGGALVLAGGGELDLDIFERFIDLAGGPDAPIVVIPTAAGEDAFGPDWEGLAPLRAAGATRLLVLHTRNRRTADSDPFVEPLRTAGGVWIPGGRQGRLVDAYLGTRVQEELHNLLDRGGVVGGSSAGASILASYLVRGGLETNEVLMVPGYEEGFGLLRNSAVDQHVLVRDRVTDLLQIVHEHPHLLGIGVDEGTALVVRGDRAEVMGRSQVAIYDPLDPGRLFFWLGPGDVYDLGRRTLEHRALDGPEAVSAGGLGG